MNWFYLSLITLVLWGVWGFLVKLSLSFIDWKQYYIVSSLPILISLPLFYLYFKPTLTFQTRGDLYAILAGITVVISSILFFLALGREKTTLVITLTALYPLITITLAFLILKERISLLQGMGVILALISIVLLSGG
jgi:transporter family protein